MDFGLTKEQKELVERITAFCKKYLANLDIDYLEKEAVDPEDVEQKLVEEGYYGFPYPKEYGGGGGNFFDYGLILEALLRGGYPFACRYQNTMMNGFSLLENGTEKQKQDILPKVIKGERTLSVGLTEPNAGTDIASLVTKGVAKDGGFAITGQKVFSSGAKGDRNIIVTATRTDPTQKRNKGLTIFLVPANSKGLQFRRLEGLGRNIGGLYEVFFDEVWVPEENILGKLNQGWATLASGLNHERAMLGAAYLGYAERIFDDIVATVKSRSLRGKRMGSYDSVASQVADFAIEVQAAKLLVFESLWKAINHKSSIPEVSQNKMYCAELIKKLGDFAMEVGAGVGYMKSSLLQWLYRESRIVTVGGGSSQIMRNVSGSMLLGLKPK